MSYDGSHLSYGELADLVSRASRGLTELGVKKSQRVAVYLEKRFETVIAMFAGFRSGTLTVPINPSLKIRQVAHILRDSGASVLVTSQIRASLIQNCFGQCPNLKLLVVVDSNDSEGGIDSVQTTVAWSDLLTSEPGQTPAIDSGDAAAILYTSGSTGLPKGVVLSHQNLVVGAQSVASYLDHREDDRILAVLPLSFDAGFSQLTTAFVAGSCVVLHNHMLPSDVLSLLEDMSITGMTAVPPLWIPLSQMQWPSGDAFRLRYIASTGGAMPSACVSRLQQRVGNARIFMMYSFTEAFRSSYLEPEQIARRPGSIGKAIPNTRLLVLREDGTHCEAGEKGELVHCGPLVAQGYWNDREATHRKFKSVKVLKNGTEVEEPAAWSGDTVTMDEDGYLYFVGRNHELIKTSAYRVSPSEVESVIYETGLVSEVAVYGVPHETLGQAIVAVVVPSHPDSFEVERLLSSCRGQLPAYMLPVDIKVEDSLPRNPNGKLDRVSIRQLVQQHDAEAQSQS